MKRSLVLFVSIAALTASALAMAGTDPIKNKGFYAGADLGLAYMISSGSNSFVGLTNSQASSLKAHGVTKKHAGFTVGGHGGYKFNRYIAAEGGYMRFPETGVKKNDSFIGAKDINVAYLAARASYPVANRVSVLGKLGYAAIFQNLKGENNSPTHRHQKTYSPMTGAGVEYHVTHKLGLDLEYTAYINTHHHHNSNSFPTTNTVTLGFNYYF